MLENERDELWREREMERRAAQSKVDKQKNSHSHSLNWFNYFQFSFFASQIKMENRQEFANQNFQSLGSLLLLEAPAGMQFGIDN